MFHSEELEQLEMGNPWKRWNQKFGFRKMDENPSKRQSAPPSEPEITPANPEASESSPLLVHGPQPSGSSPSAPDLLSGPDPAPLITPDLEGPLRNRTQSNNPFDTHSEMPTATPVHSRPPGLAPYYTVRFSGGGAAPNIQLPPVPGPYGGQGGYPPQGMPPHGGGRAANPAEAQGGDTDGEGNDKNKKPDTVVEVEEEPPQRKSPVKDQPFFMTMLFAVTILVMFIHLPLGIMIGNYMRSVSIIILVGPTGGVIGLLAVYITPCECVATREQAIGRIRYLAMVSIIMDVVGAIVMPLALYSMECPGRDGEPYNNSCQFMRIPAQGVGMAAGISVGIHLFLMIVARGSADKLSQLVSDFPEEIEEETDSDSDSDESETDSEDEREREQERKRKAKAKKEKEKAKAKKENEKAKKGKKGKKGGKK